MPPPASNYNAIMAWNRELHGARVTVMGLGRFGGGVGVTRWFVAQGARVLLTDLDPPERLAQSLAEIDDLVQGGRVMLRLGGHTPADFTGCDLVVANPAVPRPWENPFLRAAHEAGVTVTTEIRLTVDRLPRRERVIGVTGTAGKSTTSAMIARALGVTGRKVHFGGNIGGTLLPGIGEIGADDFVVLELSSAMLHWLSGQVAEGGVKGWSPGIAVVTNCAPNHLDWHGSMDHYERSKRQILRDQRPGDAVVLHAQLSSWPRNEGPESRRVEWVNYADADATPPLAIPGRHNRLNAAFALRVAGTLGVDIAKAADALGAFPGLAHRLELVAGFSVSGSTGRPIRAFNDSKSTTPEAAALAIAAMEEDRTIGASRVRLLCGGYDKRVDLSPMIEPASRCAGVYTLGATGEPLARAVTTAGGRACSCVTLEGAVTRAAAEVRPGEVLLLSPGCASWDQFTNYEARGRAFIEAIRRSLG